MIERRAAFAADAVSTNDEQSALPSFPDALDARRQNQNCPKHAVKLVPYAQLLCPSRRQCDTGQLRTVIANQTQKLCYGRRLTRTRPAGNQHKVCSKAKAASIPVALYCSLVSNQSLRLFEAAIKFTSSASALASRLISTAKSCSNCHIRPKNNFRPCRISGLSALPTKIRQVA